MASAAALKGFLAILRAEQEKRARARGQAVAASREEWYRQLDEAHARRIALPGYRPQSPEQKALALQDLDRYLASRYGAQARSQAHKIRNPT
jgi:hypothetical protein